MLRVLLPFITPLIIILLGCSQLYLNTQPIAQKGILDLRQWDFEKKGNVRLKGEWEFYWNKLIDPEQFRNLNLEINYQPLPGIWNNSIINGKKIPGEGFATYRLRILIQSNEIYGFKFYEINTAYKVWINNKFYEQTGVLGTNSKSMVPSWQRKEIFYYSSSNVIELVIQVCNFRHRKGGIEDPIYFGSSKNILRQNMFSISMELFILGILFIVTIYHIFLFFLKKNDIFLLNFSLITFLIMLRLLLTGEKLLITIFPSLNWEIAVKLEYLSFYLVVPFYINYFNNIFGESFYKKIYSKISLFITILFSLIVILTPVKIFSHTIQFYQLFTLIIGIYILYSLIILSIRKKEEALILLIGFIIILITFINDILYNNGILQTGFIFPFGLTIFVLAQALIISIHFVKAYYKAESLSLELEQKNIELKKWYELLNEQSNEKINMLLTAIEQSAESIVITDIYGNIEYVNKKFTNITGYTLEEVKGKNPRILKSDIDNTVDYANLWKQISRGNEWRGEFLNKKKNGELFWEYATIVPIKNKKGEIIHYFALKEDITEKKKIENELIEQRKKLEIRNQDVEKQLDMARNIQKQLLPSRSPWENIVYFYHSMDKIGGDFFDFLYFRNPNLLGIFLSDVSGHGIPAALITFMLKSLLLQGGINKESPEQMMKYLNKSIIGHTNDLFVTAFYAVINRNEKKMIFSNAGHNPPILIRNGKVKYITSESKSPPLAIFDNQNLEKINKLYINEELHIQEGDKILFYTDGLTDVIRIGYKDYIRFENALLLDLLENYSHLPAKELIKVIWNNLLIYRGSDNFEDDICMICIEV